MRSCVERLTVTDASSVLFEVLASGSAAVTEAEFVTIVPSGTPANNRAEIVYRAAAPAAMLASEHATVPAVTVQPKLGVTDAVEGSNCGGSVSVKVTALASEGPWLVRSIV
jgi:hypothetical protein